MIYHTLLGMLDLSTQLPGSWIEESAAKKEGILMSKGKS